MKVTVSQDSAPLADDWHTHLMDALSCFSSRLVWMSATYLASCSCDGRPAGAFGTAAGIDGVGRVKSHSNILGVPHR